MLIASISDTHGSTPDIMDGVDILTISGDITPCDSQYVGENAQLRYFYDVFAPTYSKLAKEVVFIAGNHDMFLQRIMERGNEKHFRDRLPTNMHYLRDSGVEIKGLKFWGTPWTPKFMGWYFMEHDNEEGIGKHFAAMPSGIDYLLTHGPAKGHNDVVEEVSRYTGHHLGSRILLQHIKRASPSVVMVGHIHTGSHEYSQINSSIIGSEKISMSINVSILDEQYKPHYMALYNTEE